MTHRRARLVVASFLVLAAGAAWLASGLGNDNSALVFLHPKDPIRRSYERFVRHFGHDTFVVATCRGEDAPGRAAELAGVLRELPGVAHVAVPSPGSPLTRELRLLGDDGRISLPIVLANLVGVQLRICTLIAHLQL